MKDFKKYYELPATPEEVYAALTNAHTIQLWSGEPAVMSREPGSEFALWDNSITGTNISFEENKSIVQQWDFEGEEAESIVTMKIHAHKHGTSVELRHINIPEEAYEDITTGWTEVYFAALIDFYS